MKLLRLACVGLTLSLLTQSLGLADCNCGQCCKARDDRGLLDMMDQAFSGLLAKSKKSLKSRLGAAGRPCDCQAKPSCGCEAAPGCGCEYEANCGCELTPGCDAGCACSQSVLGRAPVITPQQQVWPVAPYQPPVQQHMAPRPTAPRPQAPAPVPIPSLPDSQVDPFMDDDATRVRKPSARTIQHRTAKPSHRDRYDPQAASQTYRPAPGGTRSPTPSEAEVTVASRQFAAASSSRNRPSDTPANQQLEQDQIELPVNQPGNPSVVPASGFLPQRVSTRNVKRLSDYESPASLNPLRP